MYERVDQDLEIWEDSQNDESIDPVDWDRFNAAISKFCAFDHDKHLKELNEAIERVNKMFGEKK